jgi:hypothetical protein
MGDEFECTWKEAVVTYLNLLIHNSSEGTEKDRPVEGRGGIRKGACRIKLEASLPRPTFPLG